MFMVLIIIVLLCGIGVGAAAVALVRSSMPAAYRRPWHRFLPIIGGTGSLAIFSGLLIGRMTTVHPPPDLPAALAAAIPFDGEGLIDSLTLDVSRLWAGVALLIMLFFIWRLGKDAELAHPVLLVWKHLRDQTTPRWYRGILSGIIVGGLLLISFAVGDTIVYWQTRNPVQAELARQGYPLERVHLIMRDPTATFFWIQVGPDCGSEPAYLLLHRRGATWKIEKETIMTMANQNGPLYAAECLGL